MLKIYYWLKIEPDEEKTSPKMISMIQICFLACKPNTVPSFPFPSFSNFQFGILLWLTPALTEIEVTYNIVIWEKVTCNTFIWHNVACNLLSCHMSTNNSTGCDNFCAEHSGFFWFIAKQKQFFAFYSIRFLLLFSPKSILEALYTYWRSSKWLLNRNGKICYPYFYLSLQT